MQRVTGMLAAEQPPPTEFAVVHFTLLVSFYTVTFFFFFIESRGWQYFPVTFTFTPKLVFMGSHCVHYKATCLVGSSKWGTTSLSFLHCSFLAHKQPPTKSWICRRDYIQEIILWKSMKRSPGGHLANFQCGSLRPLCPRNS